jgi:hypothetical protein
MKLSDIYFVSKLIEGLRPERERFIAMVGEGRKKMVNKVEKLREVFIRKNRYERPGGRAECVLDTKAKLRHTSRPEPFRDLQRDFRIKQDYNQKNQGSSRWLVDTGGRPVCALRL